MAEQWKGTVPQDAQQINGGYQYTTSSQLSVQALNAIIESGLFAQNFVENLKAEVTNTTGTPSVTIIQQSSNENYAILRFSGLKGEQGVKGDKGTTGDSITKVVTKFARSNSYTNAPTTFYEYTSENATNYLTLTNGYPYMWCQLSITIGTSTPKTFEFLCGQLGNGIRSITITEK